MKKISLLLLFIFLGGICCHFCAESLFLSGLGLRKTTIWLIVIPIFCIFIIGTKSLFDSIDNNVFFERRKRKTMLSIAMVVFCGLLIIVPCQTHALYYKTNIEREALFDLITTKEYLRIIQEENPNKIDVEIKQIERIEFSIASGRMKLNNKGNIGYVDSIVMTGYGMIKEGKKNNNLLFQNTNDDVYFTQELPETRIRSMSNVFDVCSMPLNGKFDKNFFFSLIVSFLICIFSALLFIQIMKNNEI